VVATLRQAADEAFARGSPESAVSYLERCLKEPPLDTDRADILLQLGTAAQLVDMNKGSTYLAAAMAATKELGSRSVIAQMLGMSLHLAGRGDEAVQVMSQLTQAPGQYDVDLSLRVEGLIFQVGLVDPAVYPLSAHRISQLGNAAPGAGIGRVVLDLTIALYDTFIGQSREPVVERARRGLTDEWAAASSFAPCGYLALIAADQDEVMALLEAGVAEAHRRGSLLVLSPTKWLQGLAWMARGALAETEANLRDAMWSAETASHNIGKPVVLAHLADVLMEQGNVEGAEAIFTRVATSEWMTCPGYWYWILESKARLLMRQGKMKEGLDAMLASGRRFAAHGGQNPAIVAWRSGAALALFSLDRSEEAQSLAAEELMLARRWGAPRALGRALRVAGLVQGGEKGLALLHEAVDVLASSPARLEHAKALVELGAALRRSGQRIQSRQHLRHGSELAQICGAIPLAKRGWAELRATGARPRPITLSGPDALTPSERRVAELAAAGRSNRDIAQALFITTNTVEVHLTRTYRKLGVNGRADLKGILST
jgi:DNA-binding CsgD family transcriptional regulator